jgi:hypothetical protein
MKDKKYVQKFRWKTREETTWKIHAQMGGHNGSYSQCGRVWTGLIWLRRGTLMNIV